MGQETEARKDEKAQQPHSPASRSTSCRWLHVEEGSAGPGNGSLSAAHGHLLFSLLSLCACARASDCYLDYLTVSGLSISTPQLPSKLLCPEPVSEGSLAPALCIPPVALGSAWLQRAVISQPALLSSSQ